MTEENDEPSDLAARTLGGVSSGLLAFLGITLFGPAGGLFGSATAPLLTDGAKGLQKILRRRLGRADQAAEEAAKTANVSFEKLVQLSVDDDRRLEVIGRALQAAAMSESRQRITALGRLISAGVLADDSAKVDESLRIVTTLAQLDEQDVEVLAMMNTNNTGWDVRGAENSSTLSIVHTLPRIEPFAEHIVARLSNLGLIAKPDASGGINWNGTPSWYVTSYGGMCIATLKLAGDIDDDDSSPR